MFLLSPLSPLGYAVLLLRDRLDRAADRARTGDDAGITIEWVLITAFLVIIAGAVFAILYTKIVGAANNVNTAVPAAP